MARRSRKAPEVQKSRYIAENIGERLKELRLERGLTIMRLAELAGVPASTVSKIENRQLHPSLVNAIKLAAALNENLGFLVDKYRSRPEPVVVVRSDRRETIAFDEMGLVLQDLNGHFSSGVLEARVGVIKAGAHSGADPMGHPGEEFCLVLNGSMRYEIGGTALELSRGDYLHFKSDLQHSWTNSHRGETRVLWVFSDGLSF